MIFLFAILLCLQTKIVWTASFSVNCYDQPVRVDPGQDAVLNCNVIPSLPLEGLEVEWIEAASGKMVHLYLDGEDAPESQHYDYRDRTELFNDQIPNGNVSLKLKNVNSNNAGRYRCTVTFESQSVQADAELKVNGE
nr:PREDICTED: myelin-oligodendrocyte glycoprotein-like [Latimeria chalumnae]|eukprot:XP_014339715.1 PREDICTED: myelin-oligodendrocyte glycoprotein-like [Latimeria chalumnae]